MDTNFTPEDLAFREEVRAFYDAQFDDEMIAQLRSEGGLYSGMIEWQKRLNRQGWLVPSWPAEYGGTDWTLTQKYIFEDERSLRGAPDVIPFGAKMVGPVIYSFGTDEQKKQHLPGILNSDVWWCQGYSEPGAGSDLAALQTKAERDGDDYVINGAKIWTTYAQYADWIFCLVRTSSEGKKQAGISFLLIDMKTPGIEVNKISTIDENHTLNEVRFDNVRVPVANRIGEENQGWTYAKSLLAHERTSIAGVGDSKRKLSQIREHAKLEETNGGCMLDDPDFSSRLAAVEIDLMALEFLELRSLASDSAGKGPGTESSLLKLRGTEIQQELQTLHMDLAAYYQGTFLDGMSAEQVGHEYADDARVKYMYGRASTIFGGSSEVQRNITSKFVLGL